jgi:hypothetical protein
MRRGKVFFFILIGALYAVPALGEGTPQHALSDTDILAMAANKYASNELPLGDGHYVLDAPRKGYIYLCRVPPMGGGAQANGPWIQGDTWNSFSKVSIGGEVYWNQARFTQGSSGDKRVLSGNGLPVDHATGLFPILSTDLAYRYDRNPNAIRPQTLYEQLPLNPLYSDVPHCMGMEAGIMLTGVPLFGGFDAALRDAAAHEVQDRCGGHPERTGQYHYHSMSPCFKDKNIRTVLGFALDGFPITGPMVADGKYLTTDDLDECHGITSAITLDGKNIVTYHYVMTVDFPYSVGCFRANPVRTGPAQAPQEENNSAPNNTMPPGGNGMGQRPPPPAEAFAACSGRSQGTACAFVSPRGDAITGFCLTPPSQQGLICVPNRH